MHKYIQAGVSRQYNRNDMCSTSNSLMSIGIRLGLLVFAVRLISEERSNGDGENSEQTRLMHKFI